MTSPNVQAFMTNIELFFRSNIVLKLLLTAANEIVKLPKDKFVNKLTLHDGFDIINEK